MSHIRVRFAPSPTGYLHVGGARTALFNWLFARRHGGTFVLRIEDTDAARNTQDAYRAIYDGLRWLGLDWKEGPDPEAGPFAGKGDHGPYFQSQRKAVYDRHLARLQEKGLVYTEDNGAVRFRSPRVPIVMEDMVCGRVEIDRSDEPDMTLRRPDGSYIFHFVNVVDDIEMDITHVIRGEDHLMNTPKHLELFQALDAEAPIYAHIPLILNPNGSKMSKRDEGSAVGWYREEGFLPEAVVNFLCLLGWSPKDDRQKLSVAEVIELFDWDHLNRSPAKFDMDKCLWLNSQYLAEKSESDFEKMARSFLGAAAPADSRLYGLLKPKIQHLPQLREHFAMLLDDAAPLEEEAKAKVLAKPETTSLLARAVDDLAALPPENWTADGIKASVSQSAAALGVKPGALMFPLRVALTGQGHGADLMPALEILGQGTVIPRLRRRLAQLA